MGKGSREEEKAFVRTKHKALFKMAWGGAGIEISAQPFSSLGVVHWGVIST